MPSPVEELAHYMWMHSTLEQNLIELATLLPTPFAQLAMILINLFFEAWNLQMFSPKTWLIVACRLFCWAICSSSSFSLAFPNSPAILEDDLFAPSRQLR